LKKTLSRKEKEKSTIGRNANIHMKYDHIINFGESFSMKTK
jgi:hypothetical protein